MPPPSCFCPLTTGWLASVLVVTGSPIRAWPLQEDEEGIPYLRVYHLIGGPYDRKSPRPKEAVQQLLRLRSITEGFSIAATETLNR